ncbi:superoxide dismutase [Cu-Zn]-like isoform X1 [Neodiprion pinetum]|uniref:superoxide dismutase [Cu-Zn]-like isoform X1 n=2 Tax=Neodiprion pinetum TaxID=441929 RepID=UPI001EDF9598|nr:superoxide dismutase [Cu-Zn]-like isoform X1 [Neodiprion pinetum]XP_046482207.1 superoxide dismutase [Cu-Zn]-like isoform X1 [Neodiprion pinetum]XP_046482208.1 superoxide dismutase [Cu-Zn]-like isoform X1 [Neodiprion pinetum]XP_046482209.1 superoxide dismutase [Cu-Zn]-like isoform X1 [Neodiprion pinetum]
MSVKGMLTLLVFGAVAVAAEHVAVVRLTPNNVEKPNVTGNLELRQDSSVSPVKITGTIFGLRDGLHGFHVHEAGDLSNGCVSALGHFNPDKHDHGAPGDTVRHVGDLGNIESTNGVATVEILDNVISLSGRNSIVGRSIVVHEGEDDLGKGNHSLSLKTGNAGDRAACGVIGVLSPLDSWMPNSGTSFLWSSYMLILSASGMVIKF